MEKAMKNGVCPKCGSNEVINNCKNNVMILPVPYPDTIEFIDLSNYTNIFEDCQKSFNLNIY